MIRARFAPSPTRYLHTCSNGMPTCYLMPYDGDIDLKITPIFRGEKV